MIPLKRQQRRTRLPNTVTIDSIYEKNFLSASSVLEAVVLDAFLLPDTDIYMLSLGDLWSSCTIDLYLHRRYYHLVDPDIGILRKGREIFLTGCCLRTAMEGSGHPRLLPTEYLVILLDEDQDEDAMLLGAQFCSDSFSSISIDAGKNYASYSFYARIESIGSLEVQGTVGCLKSKQITLVDNDGFRLKFLLWGEQVLLANLFSIGSMLAVDRPFIANVCDNNLETGPDVCLEYGSATQLYLVPFIQHEEQVLLASTQMMCHGSRLSNSLDQTQDLKVSQVTLPLDSHGSVDFSSYPFRSYVSDLHDKMSGISLYGIVKNICREENTAETVFAVTIEDVTGTVVAKLHFARSWSLGRLGVGHTIYMSGLTCSRTKKNMLEVSWFEKDDGISFVNISCLPSLLNSSCIHQLSPLSDISGRMYTTHISQVRLDKIELPFVQTVPVHSLCGHHVDETLGATSQCSFCHCSCDSEVVRSFHVKMAIADENRKISAWCTGQAAAELLQISPDEFYHLPEEEKGMYLFTLENEKFTVALVCCESQSDYSDTSSQDDYPIWEITRAQKCE